MANEALFLMMKSNLPYMKVASYHLVYHNLRFVPENVITLQVFPNETFTKTDFKNNLCGQLQLLPGEEAQPNH